MIPASISFIVCSLIGCFRVDAPPLPQKSGSVQSQSQPPVPNRSLKPSPGSQRPYLRRAQGGRLPVPAPSLPPKNVQGRSSGLTPPEAHPHPATSAQNSIYSHPRNITGSAQLGTKPNGVWKTFTGAYSPVDDPVGSVSKRLETGSGSVGAYSNGGGAGGTGETGTQKISTGMNVLQRIAQIEEENIRASADGRTKGMEIALSLKERVQRSGSGSGNSEASSKKSGALSIRKTWRKLLDKVEDSFSDNEM